jgi:hypothetical protein
MVRSVSKREYEDIVEMARDAFRVGISSVSRGFVRALPLTLPRPLEPNRWSRLCGEKGMKPSGWNSLAQKSK